MNMKDDGFCQPVYEEDGNSVLGYRLVVTPYMLMDELCRCNEEMESLIVHLHRSGLGQEERMGLPYNPVAARLENANFIVEHLLRLLWRGGLWTDCPVEERMATNGVTYQVLNAPFTDGRPQGRPLPENAPAWLRELLGMEHNEFATSLPAENNDSTGDTALPTRPVASSLSIAL